MRRCLFASILAAAIVLAAASTAQAQGNATGALRGTVKDDSGAVMPGATVEISSPALIGGVKALTTDERGEFRATGLASGLYTITVTLQGFQTVRREGIRVEVGQQFDIDFVLKVGTVKETVTVVGESSLIDTSRSAMTTTVSAELVKSTPVTRFSFFDLAYMTPGVSTQRFDNTASRAVAFGSNVNENQYQFDGADVTAFNNGAAWVWPSTDTIAELQVVALGAPAEYGNYQGAVFNVITKSGSNDLSLSANYYWQPPKLTGENGAVYNSALGTATPYTRNKFHDFTALAGGPIKTDKVWFFGSYEIDRNYFSEVGTNPATPQMTQDAKYFVKVTWQVNPKHKLWASYHYDPSAIPRPVTISTPYVATGAEISGGRTPGADWNWLIDDKTVFEARYYGFYSYDYWAPNSGNTTTPAHSDSATGVSSVNSSSWYDGNVSKTTFSAKLSHYVSSFAGGSHDLRGGMQWMNGGSNYRNGYSGGMFYSDYNGRPDQLTVQAPYHTGAQVRSLGFFIDDTMRFGSRFSLNAGIRYDRSVGNIPDFPVLDATGNPTSTTIANPGNVIFWNVISPRVGANFKLDSQGKTMVRVHYGRFYQGLNTPIFSSMNRAVSPSYVYKLDPVTGAQVSLISTTDPLIGLPQVDPNLRGPYTDQFSVGVDHQLFANFSVGGSLIYKNTADMLGRIKPNAVFTTKSYTYTDRNGQSRTIDVFSQNNTDALGNLQRIINQPIFWQKYKGLVVQANKRLADNWTMLASITVQKSTGLTSGSGATDPYGNQSANTGSFGADPNDLTNTSGTLTGDRPVMFKMQAAYHLPRQMALSMNYQAMSGRPVFTRVRTPSGLLNQGRVYIQDVPKTEQVIRPDPNKIFDVRFEKGFRLPHLKDVGIALDIFNIFNNNSYYSVASTIIPSSTTPPGYQQGVILVPPRRAQLIFRIAY